MRLIDKKELLARVPYSHTHIWRLEQEGRFPKRVKVGGHRVAWVEAEVDAWIKAKLAERDSVPQEAAE